ncbi:4-galactosyl-N-acetylglucosaminide 3-alpha-L-fucosyltransferase 9-like [Salminus brasiliensis]|uniref:4-galactosyl-N-acetylglucosaminide 3-alpha-L-fucosyltransferase 9-like n=1 Tax=Salminus brasiliensis TaxID=930266 RepID=UPI003B82CDF6
MMLPSKHILIACILLLCFGAMIYVYYKQPMNILPYPDAKWTTHDVCTEACLDILTKENQAQILNCSTVEKSVQPTAPAPAPQQKKHVPMSDRAPDILILVWLWPFGERFSMDSCEALYNIKNCHITEDRGQYDKADAVLFHVRDIFNDMENLRKLPRPPEQRWVWMNSESPGWTPKLAGGEDLFNLTSNYKRDADIWVPYGRVMKATEEERTSFKIPQKDKLVCWIVSHWEDKLWRVGYFNEFSQHIKVEGYGQHFGRKVSGDDYFKIISSCKFYLSFENSIYKDYITEKVYNPLTLGTVPVVIGPPRSNYEEYLPAHSFIHINDFSTPKELADYLIHLDKNQALYEEHFHWRKYFVAKLGLAEEHACRTCEYLRSNGMNYRVFKDVNAWYSD